MKSIVLTTEWRCDRCGKTTRVDSLAYQPVPLPAGWTRETATDPAIAQHRDLCGGCHP